MPTVLRSGPYRFFFYSGDRHEPPHVHIEGSSGTAKFWMEPIRLAWSHGFSAVEVNRIDKVISKNSQKLIESWNEFFSN